jgi:glycosyltransferase involved in cell wall biosynthesis
MVSFVLPSYNPPANWEHVVVENYQKLAVLIEEDIEIVVINDGSILGHSEKSITYLGNNLELFKYIKYDTNAGKGYALRKGVAEAAGDLIIYTDIDFPYTNESILDIYKQLKEGADIVIGVKDKAYYSAVPAARRVVSKLFRRLIRTFLSIPVTDTQCGLKGFRKECKYVFLGTTIDRYLFDLEFVYNSFKQKPPLKITPTFIVLKPGVVFRTVNMRIIAAELRNFARILLKK